MRYSDAIEWIHSLLPLGIKPGLKRMEWLLERLNHPEHRLAFIHIAGTNGKGSTAAFIASVLQEAQYDVGMFTSPYIDCFNDRIRFNGEYISNEHLVSLVKQIKPLAEELAETELGLPTEFEVITVMAILYFARIKKPHLVVWETGLGGRLDSTNIVRPLISVITNIAYDHMNILGDTLQDIAREKAGIIKNGVHVVTSEKNPVSFQVIKETAVARKAPVYQLGKQFHLKRVSYSPEEQIFIFKGPYKEYNPVRIKLLGEHQIENAGTALMVLELLRQFYAIHLEESDVIEGMTSAFWPGRFEKMQHESMPMVILDGAHNPEGVRSLTSAIKELYPDKNIHLLFAALKDKKWDSILAPLLSISQTITVSQVKDNPRKADGDQIVQWITDRKPGKQVNLYGDGEEGLQHIMKFANSRDIILITGSLYFISEMRKKCLQMFEEAGVNGEYV